LLSCAAFIYKELVVQVIAGDIVVMDNLPVHKVAGVAEAIEAAGAGLDPIESAFSKLKAHLRKAAEHTAPRLLRRIGRVVTDFSAKNAKLLSSRRLRSNMTGS